MSKIYVITKTKYMIREGQELFLRKVNVKAFNNLSDSLGYLNHVKTESESMGSEVFEDDMCIIVRQNNKLVRDYTLHYEIEAVDFVGEDK